MLGLKAFESGGSDPPDVTSWRAEILVFSSLTGPFPESESVPLSCLVCAHGLLLQPPLGPSLFLSHFRYHLFLPQFTLGAALTRYHCT